MKSNSALILPLVCLVAHTTLVSRTSAAVLPGARPEINAIEYPSIQAAIDAVSAEGGMVRLPPGTFEINKPLVISRSDIRIEGAGSATHIKNMNVNGRTALLIQHPDGRDVSNEDRLWRVMLGNFRLTGNERSGPGIQAVRINELFIQGVTVSNHGGHGIFLDYCYEDPRINDCLITYNQHTGLQLDGCHDIVVSGNQFEENLDAIACRDGFNLCMSGNNLDDHLRHGVIIENTYGSVVSGNMIEECKGTAIVMDRDAYGNTISANVIAHNGAGIDLRDAHGCAVSANTFTINATDAVRLGPSCTRITVAGNNFSNSYIGNGQVKRSTNDLAAAGITLEGAKNVVIAGNLFSSLNPKALETRGGSSRKVLFSNNLLVDVATDESNLQDSLVRGNLKSTD